MLYIEEQVASVASMSSNQRPISATYFHPQRELCQTTLTTQPLLTQKSPLPTRRPRPITKAKIKPIQADAFTVSPSHLSYWANNPCSLNNEKRQELFARLSALHIFSRPHVIFFAETWFTDLSDVTVPGYQPHRKDRDKRGDGVAIYTRDDIIVSEVSSTQLNSTSIEQIWRKIKLGQESFLLGCLYRPHDENDQVLTQCIPSITTAQQILPNINCSAMLVYGDFNFSHTSYESIEVNGGIATVAHVRGERQGDIRFQKCLDEFHLTQLITFPTYRCSRHVEPTSTLDLIITNEPDRVIIIKQGDSLDDTPMGQAHCFIEGQFAVACLNNSPTLPLKPRLIWIRANYAAISAHIAAVEWETVFTGLNANDEYQLLANVYNEATNLHIPSTTTPFTEKQEQWVTPELIEAVKAKRTSWAKYINAGRYTHKFLKISHRTACKKVKKMVKAGRQKYEELLVRDSESNPKRLHAYVRSKQNVSNNITSLETVNSNITTDTGDISASLNNYFQSVFVLEPEGSVPGFEIRTEPVCVIDPASFSIDIVQKCLNNLDERKSTGYDGLHPRVLSKYSATFAKPLSLIYKCSFATGVVPELWKKSNVTPIFKKGSRLKASNYRPVSLTSIPCKIMESILQKRIMEHCVANGLISPNQHGSEMVTYLALAFQR
ncbi:uncharacterized protein LOC136091975 [Hydra vulgaris]|uniref:Uncharacterized protein LOC136091975 n=1 Tax=Hydra vulgaris TaxID=6087 RepID=A0ABM4DMH8_HYDVU